ncbi:MAG: amidohydrolase family protein [Paracoccaceae bacterium]|nr:amidohydrolase family protein [Paracoccaceae bacterium]
MSNRNGYFDARIRPPFGEFLKLPRYNTKMKQGLVSYAVPPASISQRSMPALFSEMDEVGIARGLAMGRHTATNAWIPNDTIASLRREHGDRFWTFGGVGESTPLDNLMETMRCIEELNLDGIALDPGWLQPPLRVNDPAFYPVYAFCEARSVPVSVSMSINSGPDLSFCDPCTLQRVAMDFRTLRIVVSHASWPMVTPMLAVAAKLPNVWLIPDLYMNTPGLPGRTDFVEAARHPILCKKIIFGTAYPSQSLEASMSGFDEAGISEPNRDAILRTNLLEFLGET